MALGVRVAVALSVSIVSLVAVGVSPAAACSCLAVSDQEAFASADAVFVGTSGTSYLGEPGGHVYTVMVDSVYKGSVRDTQQIVTTGCAGGPKPQDQSLVFAYIPRDPNTRTAGALELHCTAPRSLVAGPIPASFGDASEPSQAPSRLIPVLDQDRRDEIRWPLSLFSITAALAAGGATATYASRRRRTGRT